jgi:hypothetical protein
MVSFLIPLAGHTNVDREAQRLAVTCLGNLCSKAGPSLRDHYKPIYSVLKANFDIYATQIYNDLTCSKVNQF